MLRFKTAMRGAIIVCLIGLLTVAGGGCGGGGGGATATLTGILADTSTLLPLASAIAQVQGRSSLPTDASGAFTITGIPTGTRTFSAFLSGYETLTFTITLGPGNNDLGTAYLQQVEMVGQGHITGVVADAGSAVPNAVVTAAGRSAVTKSDGSFVIRNVAPGTRAVSASLGPKTGIAVANVLAGATASVSISLSISPPPPPVI